MPLKKVIGQSKLKKEFQNTVTNLENKKGKVIGIAGDVSMGKTFMLNTFMEQYKSNQNFRIVYADNQSPIGNFRVSMIQPLMPFSRIIQQLAERMDDAQKRFAVNVGMTTLASLPIIGDIFYAVKEYGRDWRQYKREKSSETGRKMNPTVADFYDTIVAESFRLPLLILLDNLHNADSVSLELLQNFTEKMPDIPISIIFTYNPSMTGHKFGAFDNYIAQLNENINCLNISLEPFGAEEVRAYCKQNMDAYKASSEFEEWLLNKTFGVPGYIDGYLQHFKKKSPFDEKGKLDLGNEDVFPEDIYQALSKAITNLSEEDKNALSICSVEGKEFSAYLIAQLLNTDVLTAIKRLKVLQNKTGVIRSTGVKTKYGVKTTVYEYTQPYFHSYFDSILEYEERVSLHGQIAAFLKNKLDETSNKNLKNELAPYIVAHSIISGDDDTAKEMLVVSARAANEIDSREVIENAFSVYQELSSQTGENSDQNADSVIFKELINNVIVSMPAMSDSARNSLIQDANYPIDFNYVRRTIVDEYHKKNYSKSIELAETYIFNHKKTLKPSEETQLMALIARSEIELENLDRAEEVCIRATELISDKNEPISDTFIKNVSALIEINKGNNDKAYRILQSAAKKAMSLPPEIRLLTLSNIALLLKSLDDNSAEKFLQVIRRLTNQLNFDEFAVDVFN